MTGVQRVLFRSADVGRVRAAAGLGADAAGGSDLVDLVEEDDAVVQIGRASCRERV